jgi:hypothetical protein
MVLKERSQLDPGVSSSKGTGPGPGGEFAAVAGWVQGSEACDPGGKADSELPARVGRHRLSICRPLSTKGQETCGFVGGGSYSRRNSKDRDLAGRK